MVRGRWDFHGVRSRLRRLAAVGQSGGREGIIGGGGRAKVKVGVKVRVRVICGVGV